VLGVLAGSPLAAALTSYLAIPILLLVTVFGILVLTGTPLHTVPDRLRALVQRDREDDDTDDTEDDDDELADEILDPAPSKRRRRRRHEAEAGTPDSSPFSASPLLADIPAQPEVPAELHAPLTTPTPRNTEQLPLGHGTYQLPAPTM